MEREHAILRHGELLVYSGLGSNLENVNGKLEGVFRNNKR